MGRGFTHAGNVRTTSDACQSYPSSIAAYTSPLSFSWIEFGMPMYCGMNTAMSSFPGSIQKNVPAAPPQE